MQYQNENDLKEGTNYFSDVMEPRTTTQTATYDNRLGEGITMLLNVLVT